MNMIRRYILPLVFLLTASLLTGCLDETFAGYDGEIGEGDADLRATVEFENLTPALETRTPGNAIGPVSNLQMVIYKVENGKSSFFRRVVCNDLSDYKLTTTNTAEPGDVDKAEQKYPTLGSTGETTDHADYTYSPLPYGRYKIYAVANVPGLTDEQCETEEKLKSLSFTWNSSDIAANNAMFGYFTRADDQASTGFDAPVIIVNSKNIDLHAWIKRLVSKVTVAFDPSELKEAVTVYIKSVTIHDIPLTCPLGRDNKPASDKDLIANGESIDYYTPETANDYTKWGIILQKGSGKKGSNHSNTDNALFFFENMQGDYEGDRSKWKPQIPEETGNSIDSPGDNLYGQGTNDFKDRVPYGTYIEVIAYYVSKNTEKMSSGNIKYRFMLGKNITYDYNAQRNYHYKLTLKLRGFANEADWHISYTEPTPSLYTPDKYYVSYLYGQESGFPVRIITGDDENTSRYTLKAEIIENPWWPYDEDSGGYPPLYVGAGDDINGFAWMKSAVEYGVSGGVLSTPYYVGANRDFAGFLALRKPEMKNGKYADIEFDVKETSSDFLDNNYGPLHNDKLREYYVSHNVAHAAYTLADGTRNVGLYNTSNNTFTTGSGSDGQYTVKRDQDGSVTLSIPMYTRPKKMISEADFTGNNPYSSYMRRALVRFTLWDEKGKQVKFKDLTDNDKEVDHRDVPVFQVRRVENPKAIYRAWNNSAPFDVKLMHLRNPNSTTLATKFTTFTSDGPWRASILTTTEDFVRLTGPDGKRVERVGDYINGSTGTTIEFTYEPKGSCASANSERCAIILVEYHDYTCNHLIFVRQGYDNSDKGHMTLAGTKWSNYQVYATAGNRTDTQPENISSCNVVVTQSPLSMGSLLKRCQYNFSIREADNPGWLKSVTNDSLSLAYVNSSKVAAIKTALWRSIEAYGWRNYAGTDIRYNIGWADTWTTVQYKAGRSLTVPTRQQYEALRDQCDFGFGIAYADGATTTAELLDDAYGYLDATNTGVTSAKGTRACVAYDSSTGVNVLFPLGYYGNGRRAAGGAGHSGNPPSNLSVPSPGAGTLSYGGVSSVLYHWKTEYRPVTYNHYRTPGATYWIKLPYYANGDKLKAYAAWDINYFTLTFNKYAYNSLANFDAPKDDEKLGGNSTNISDALPIKLVYK